jgi:hypothetical protein
MIIVLQELEPTSLLRFDAVWAKKRYLRRFN